MFLVQDCKNQWKSIRDRFSKEKKTQRTVQITSLCQQQSTLAFDGIIEFS